MSVVCCWVSTLYWNKKFLHRGNFLFFRWNKSNYLISCHLSYHNYFSSSFQIPSYSAPFSAKCRGKHCHGLAKGKNILYIPKLTWQDSMVSLMFSIAIQTYSYLKEGHTFSEMKKWRYRETTMGVPQGCIRLTFAISLGNYADVAFPRSTERNSNLKIAVQWVYQLVFYDWVIYVRWQQVKAQFILLLMQDNRDLQGHCFHIYAAPTVQHSSP